MELLFALALGGMIVFNGAIIVYFLWNAYVLPQFFPNLSKFWFWESVIFAILGCFLFIIFFGNRITQKKRKTAIGQKQNPALLRFGEKSR